MNKGVLSERYGDVLSHLDYFSPLDIGHAGPIRPLARRDTRVCSWNFVTKGGQPAYAVAFYNDLLFPGGPNPIRLSISRPGDHTPLSECPVVLDTLFHEVSVFDAFWLLAHLKGAAGVNALERWFPPVDVFPQIARTAMWAPPPRRLQSAAMLHFVGDYGTTTVVDPQETDRQMIRVDVEAPRGFWASLSIEVVDEGVLVELLDGCADLRRCSVGGDQLLNSVWHLVYGDVRRITEGWVGGETPPGV